MDLETKYVKLDQHEHVLARPNMYIGSVEPDVYDTWVCAGEDITKQTVSVIPGLYKIYDEILVNAIDHVSRLKLQQATHQVRNIKIDIDQASGEVSIFNDGDGIEVELHKLHNVYIPELIFGYLLTSTNYDDAEEKTIGGQNGIGAKACNIFSQRFTLETVDAVRKKVYTQTWSNNMKDKTKPVIRACSKKPYTRITFLPDYTRFGLRNGLTDDMYALFVKRALDVCALTDADVNVYVNGVKVESKNFEKYTNLYDITTARVYDKVSERWEVIATASPNDVFEQVSFVNGVSTIRGGKHVDHIANQVCAALATYMNKKRGSKDAEIKQQHIKNNLMLFVKATIVNPVFDSQTKEFLTTPATKFGSKPEISDKFIEKLARTEVAERAIMHADAGTQKALKRTDGKKQSKIKGIPKLDDAHFAGTPKSDKCCLILTEGDSARATAIAGLAEVNRDYYGVYPLRGKLMNVKDVSASKLLENEEIQAIKKIMGLESGKVYGSLKELRYGRIVIMTDADEDGKHIKGLIMNLFHTLWPSLIDKGLLTSLLTPIIKVTSPDGKRALQFYNISDFEAWKHGNNNIGKWTIKYYKGLGTSSEAEAKTYFKNMKLAEYEIQDAGCTDALDLAFNKKRADDRKAWLKQSAGTVHYGDGVTVLSFKDFINKELVHFSVYDVKRSIPSVVDGLKPSQRKILYCCFKRNLVNETKVAQLSGYVSEHAAYHHGEASLQAAIINMAQDFVGSNNINLLLPNGMFGTRMSGKDASAPRYIFTALNPVTLNIFRTEDVNLLNYLDDDGYSVEPEFYVPVIPMVLVNGALGIGTGYSTSIPSYNPVDIINTVRDMIRSNGRCATLLVPWYRNFKGTVVADGTAFTCHGCYRITSDTTATITELPVGVWTDDYKEMLEKMVESSSLAEYRSTSTIHDVHIELKFKGAINRATFEKDFKLVTRILTSNMHLFNERGAITKYDSIQDIFEDFYRTRHRFYVKRKAATMAVLERDKKDADDKRRFIQLVINKTIPLLGMDTQAVEKTLDELKFERRDDGTFAHLLNMPIQSLTADRALALQKHAHALQTKLTQCADTSVEQLWLHDLTVLQGSLQNAAGIKTS